MFSGLIVKVSVEELFTMKELPAGCIGVEVMVPDELQTLKWLVNEDCSVPIVGFRMSYKGNRRFDIMHIIEDFSFVCYLAQIVNQIAIKQHNYIYINLASHYSLDFYLTNDEFMARLGHNLIFIQNIYNYVEFVVDNVLPHVKTGNRTVFAENGGAPINDVVELLRSRGCNNVYAGIDCKCADIAISTNKSLSSFTLGDYFGSNCKIITLGDDNNSFCRAYCHTLRQMSVQRPVVIHNNSAIYKIASECL